MLSARTVSLALGLFLAASSCCQATVVGEDDFESYGVLNPAPDPLDGTAAGGLLWHYIDGQGDGINTNDHRTFFAPGAAGGGFNSTGWVSQEQGGGLNTSISLASLAGSAFDNGAGGIVNGSLFKISFVVGAETSNTTSNIQFNYDVSSSSGVVGFVSGGSADGSTSFASLMDGGTVTGGTRGASGDRRMSVTLNTNNVSLASTIDFSITRGTGTNNPFIFFDDFVLEALDGVAPNPELVINRDTGNITLHNDTANGINNIIGYSLLSTAGSFNQANWDRQSTGSQLANDDDTWTVLTAPGVSTDLSEAVLSTSGAGNGGDLVALGGTWTYGNVWRKSPFEDVSLELLLDDGTTLQTGDELVLRYTGNNDMPFAVGDLDTDGDIDVADWIGFKAGYGTDLTGLTAVAAYLAADLTGDGLHTLADFAAFEAAFDGVNGAGAFQEMIHAIPEPTCLSLSMLAGMGLVSLRRRRCPSPRRAAASSPWIAIVLLMSCTSRFLHAQALDSSTFAYQYNGDQIFNGSSMVAPWAINGGIELDDLSLNGTNLVVTPLSGADLDDNNGWIEQDGGATPWDMALTGIVNQPRWALDVSMKLNNINGAVNDNIAMWAEGGGNRQVLVIGANSVATLGGTQLDNSVNTDAFHAFQLQFDATDTTAGPSGTYQLYRDGVLIGDNLPRESAQSLSRLIVGDCCTSLGNPVDQYEIGHVRFDVNREGLLTLTVNPTSGAATISNLSNNVLQVDSYSITSAGSLNPAGWTPLENNPLYGNGIPNDGIGFEVLSSTSTQLAEADLTGFATFDPNESVNIGSIFTAGMPQDLVFTIGLDNGFILEANVVYATGNGDFNHDGQWNCLDINMLSAAIATGSTDLQFDMNGDGMVTVSDITANGTGWLAVGGANNLAQTGGDPFIQGDANLDGSVDGSDFGIWNSSKFTFNNAYCAGDFDANGAVEGSDFGVWNAHKFTSALAQAVPEPIGGISWISAIVGIAVLTRLRRTQNGARLVTAAVVMLAGPCVLSGIASADAFDDRVYHFGDDAFEGGAVGAVIGTNVPPPFNDGRTLDSMGNSGQGDFQDLFVDFAIANNAPVYTDTLASGRPGATAADRIGARFDGSGDGLRGRELNSPNDTWRDLFNANPQYPNNWTGIFTRGIQAWVRPAAAGGAGMAGIGGGLRQDIVTDTGQHGIYISANDKWGLLFDNGAFESAVPAVAGQWTHVMERSLRGARGGALLVNGIAVRARDTFYDPADGDMTVGGSRDLLSNYFKGDIDEMTMFVSGNNSTLTPVPGEPPGMDWGAVDLAVDNDWIQIRLATLGVTDPADVNLDTVVNTADVTAFIPTWRSEHLVDGVRVGDWNSRQNGDLNYDGLVDLRDAFVLHEGLLAATGKGLDFSLLVPEPVTGTLTILLGILASLPFRFRYR